MCMHLYTCTHTSYIYMNISINSHNHLTSTIWSEYVSEQIRPSSAAGRLRSICIPRVGSSEADPTKNFQGNTLVQYTFNRP